jgi:capsular polysaccharide export protein
MNVAYLDPPYSYYFHELSRHLAQRTGGSTVALLSCPSYRMYVHGDRSLLWHAGPVDRIHPVPAPFERAAWACNGAAEFQQAFSHAVEWFKARFLAERIELCLAFSDARPFSQAALIAAQAVGVVCLFFERGAFRYRSASLSTQGLNARFDLRRARRGAPITGLTAKTLPPRRPTEPWLRARFLWFMLVNGIVCSRDRSRSAMQHKRYHPFNYARIALSQFLSEHPALQRGRADAAPRGPCVLLPLQLQTDSQFVMHSPFAHNQALIDFVVPRVRAALPDAEVIVKRHPMDVRSYRLPEGARFIDGNLAHWIPQARAIVCLNSAAGFEAAIRGKTVLCFGASFYTEHERVVRVGPQDFERRFAAAVARADDRAAGAKLRNAVLRYYQAPGDVWAYSADDLRATADIVLQHVRAARGAAAKAAAPVPVKACATDRDGA